MIKLWDAELKYSDSLTKAGSWLKWLQRNCIWGFFFFILRLKLLDLPCQHVHVLRHALGLRIQDVILCAVQIVKPIRTNLWTVILGYINMIDLTWLQKHFIVIHYFVFYKEMLTVALTFILSTHDTIYLTSTHLSHLWVTQHISPFKQTLLIPLLLINTFQCSCFSTYTLCWSSLLPC